jgi:hypothetical protein
MGGLGDEENLPTSDSLHNTLAFRGNSAQLFREAVEEVKRLSEGGREIFPPRFATLENPKSASALRTEPYSIHDGHLNPDEAVAIKILLDESSALYQYYAINFETSHKIREILGLKQGDWQSDVMDGLAEFGIFAGLAAGVREQIERNSPPLEDMIKKDWWSKFEEPLRKDGLVLGKYTVEAIEKVVAGYAERDIPTDPEGAKTPQEIRARIESKKHGAKLAGMLFLEARELASKTSKGH